MDNETSFLNTALGKARKHAKKKRETKQYASSGYNDDWSSGTNVMLLDPCDSKEMDDDVDEQILLQNSDVWVYQDGEKRLPLESTCNTGIKDSSQREFSSTTNSTTVTSQTIVGSSTDRVGFTDTQSVGTSDSVGTETDRGFSDKSSSLMVGQFSTNPVVTCSPAALEGTKTLLLTKRTDTSDIHAARVYKKNNVNHLLLWRYAGESKVYSIEEYPEKWDGLCNSCHRRFSSIPLFPPSYETGWDGVKKTWVLQHYAHCSKLCSKRPIIEGGSVNKEQLLSQLSRFIRDFFDPECESIPYIPLCLIKEVNPHLGKLTWEEYDNIKGTCNVFVSPPEFRYVNTWVEIMEPKQRELGK